METKFTEQESLQVINSIIKQAQGNLQKGAGDLTIFWGYLVAFTALANFSLAFVVSHGQSSYVWLLMIPGWIISFWMRKKKDHSALVKTHIDRIITFTWAAFGISVFLLQFTFWALFYFFKGETIQFVMMTPLMLILSGSMQYITGKVCRFKPYVWGGIISWIGAIACTCILQYVLYHFLILAVCMILGFAVPGHQLNKKAKEYV